MLLFEVTVKLNRGMDRMKKVFLSYLSVLMSLSLILFQFPVAKADNLGSITQYSVGNNSGLYGITEGPDGNLWFTVSSTNKIVKMTKAGVLTEYTLPSTLTRPERITRGHDGNLWFNASYAKGSRLAFGKISTAGVITGYDLNTNYNGQVTNIISGPDGYIYIGLSNGSSNNSYIQKITTSGGLVASYNVGAWVNELTPDYKNNLIWYAARGLTTIGTNSGAQIIGKIGIDGGSTQYTAPSGTSELWSITIGPDGKPWFAGNNGKVGSIDILGNFSQFYTVPGSVGINSIRTGLDGNLWTALTGSYQVAKLTPSGTASVYNLYGGGKPRVITPGTDGNMWVTQYDNNKIAKIGTGVNSSSTDADSDSLNAGLELSQGTSDFDADTDSDGLSDYTESTIYPNRTTTFCGTACAYPDPLNKDLYIEIDWMVNGSFSTKPSTQDLSGAAVAYGNKGIKLHTDLGSYGGGNQVDYSYETMNEPTNNLRDYFDYKRGGDGVTAQFDFAKRYKVWRYMLSVDRIVTPDNQTDLNGAAIVGDDDSLIAYGHLNANYTGVALTEEVQQTIIHEIGHNLCLASSFSYSGHDSSCIYSSIDTNQAPASYVSAMKYNGTVLDLSSGVNAPNDHDDWSAVLNKGFDDFVISVQGDYEYSLMNSSLNQSNTRNKIKKEKPLFTVTKNDKYKNR